jgi:hypothetical protein
MFASARTGGHRSAKRKACSSEKTNKEVVVMDGRISFNFYEEKTKKEGGR